MHRLDEFFGVTRRGSTLRTEVMAGLTTFFAMAYIVFVNPAQVAAGGAAGWLAGLGADGTALGRIWNAVFVGSVLAAIVGTLMFALYANRPYAQACGMGLNSFFCTCFVSGAFFAGVDVIRGYQSGLVIIFLSGVIFFLLSVTGARKQMAMAMPACLKQSITAGIGLFITYIGLQNAGIIQNNQFTLTQFVNIHGADWETVYPALTALIGLILITVLAKRGVKGAVLIGVLASSVLFYVFRGQMPAMDLGAMGDSFRDFGEIGLLAIFRPQAWKDAFTGAHIGGLFSAIVLIITFSVVDMFDTIGALYGTAAQSGDLDKNGDPVFMDSALVCDSTATLAGAALGTSTCTTFLESASGIALGGRTGLSSLVTAGCFLVCLFLSPLAGVIPGAATASALIYVGVLMMGSFKQVDMKDMLSAVPAFLTLIMMPLTYSIANGIGIGAIAYTLLALFTGRYGRKDRMVTLIAVLFVLKFLLVTM